jgi:hypothetical protein
MGAVRLLIVRFSASDARLDSKSPVSRGDACWFNVLLLALLMLLLLLMLLAEVVVVCPADTGCNTPPRASKPVSVTKLKCCSTNKKTIWTVLKKVSICVWFVRVQL